MAGSAQSVAGGLTWTARGEEEERRGSRPRRGRPAPKPHRGRAPAPCDGVGERHDQERRAEARKAAPQPLQEREPRRARRHVLAVVQDQPVQGEREHAREEMPGDELPRRRAGEREPGGPRRTGWAPRRSGSTARARSARGTAPPHVARPRHGGSRTSALHAREAQEEQDHEPGVCPEARPLNRDERVQGHERRRPPPPRPASPRRATRPSPPPPPPRPRTPPRPTCRRPGWYPRRRATRRTAGAGEGSCPCLRGRRCGGSPLRATGLTMAISSDDRGARAAASCARRTARKAQRLRREQGPEREVVLVGRRAGAS